MAWPVEDGGRGLSPIYDAILNEEAGRVSSPPITGTVNYLGRAIYTYGSDEHKAQHLVPLMKGEISWCQGFSQPEAGSDLASLRTRALLDGDEYVVNGQKMWTSGGQYADWCLLLARTDPEAPKHKGISCLLVDMRTPGITVRPIVLADGDPETCEVFWDDVRVPVTNRLGEPGLGWKVAMTAVTYERGPADIGFISSSYNSLRTIEDMAVANGTVEDPLSAAGSPMPVYEARVYASTSSSSCRCESRDGRPGPRDLSPNSCGPAPRRTSSTWPWTSQEPTP